MLTNNRLLRFDLAFYSPCFPLSLRQGNEELKNSYPDIPHPTGQMVFKRNSSYFTYPKY